MDNFPHYVDIFNYNQSEIQFWHVKPHDYEHKKAWKTTENQLKLVKFVLKNWHAVCIEAHILER